MNRISVLCWPIFKSLGLIFIGSEEVVSVQASLDHLKAAIQTDLSRLKGMETLQGLSKLLCNSSRHEHR